MPMSAVLHLICGQAGAGKTTYAKKLENRRSATRFSKDQWVIALHGRNLRMEEWNAAQEKCYRLIAELTVKLLAQKIDVILDYGFWYREERLAAKDLAASVGATAMTHYLDTPGAIRRERVLSRNHALDDDSVEISPDAFEKQLDWFEKPSDAEGIRIMAVCGS